MNNRMVRLLIFTLLWIGILIEGKEESTFFTLSFIICAIAFALYFFIPISKKPIYLYIALQIVIFCLVLLHISLAWIMAIMLYIMVESSLKLSTITYRKFITLSLSLLVLCCIIENEWLWPMMFLTLLLSILSVYINRYSEEREEQRTIYDELISEFRQTKRMNVENERIVRLQERTRIAHDMHDSVGHKLTALLMQLEIMAIQNKTSEYVELKKLAKESLEETRHAVKALKYDEVTGIESVLQLIKKLESENHIIVKFTSKQGVLRTKLTNKQSIVMYRSIQEALTNAMKHGSTRDISVTLGMSAIGDVEWIVKNGMKDLAPYTIGFGLTAMRERIEEVGGKLRVYQVENAFVLEGSMPIEVKV